MRPPDFIRDNDKAAVFSVYYHMDNGACRITGVCRGRPYRRTILLLPTAILGIVHNSRDTVSGNLFNLCNKTAVNLFPISRF